jgi:NADH/F420H2 dehydrogenase subunit C
MPVRDKDLKLNTLHSWLASPNRLRLWNQLTACFPLGDVERLMHYGEPVLRVRRSSFVPLIHLLRDQSCFQFKTLVDMTAVDYPSRSPRFEVVYQRLSVRFQTRCRVKVRVDETTLVPTISHLFASAGWTERECFDMFGIGFDGHPDLRRILTDYGFEGHPRRKDFPLTGFTEVRYDEATKRVVCEPLERSQDFRAFDFRSAWKPMLDAQVVVALDALPSTSTSSSATSPSTTSPSATPSSTTPKA